MESRLIRGAIIWCASALLCLTDVARGGDTKTDAYNWLKAKMTAFGDTRDAMTVDGKQIFVEAHNEIVALDECALVVRRVVDTVFIGLDSQHYDKLLRISMANVKINEVHLKTMDGERKAAGGYSNAVMVEIPTTEPSERDGSHLTFNSREIAERAVKAVTDLAVACGAKDEAEKY